MKARPSAAPWALAASIVSAACALPRSAETTPRALPSVTVPVTLGAPDPTCARCHAEKLAPQAARKVQHAPFRSGTCTICHQPHGEGEKPRPTAAQPALCLRCHGGDEFRRPHVHSIVTQDGCTACHAPHASERPGLLTEAPEALCGSCHDGLAAKHGGLPVEGTQCLGCHSPHSSAGPKLVREVAHEPLPDCSSCHAPQPGKPFARSEEPPALCLQCHDGIEKELKAKTVHAAVNDAGCTACHSPHASRRAKLLTEPRPALCYGCHTEIQEKLAAKGAVAHVPARDGRCGACHAPHASARPKLLSSPAEQLCFGCHPKARTWAASPSAHGPVRSGDCSECHDPHAAGPSLLAKRGSALCATCHEVQAEEQKRAQGHKPVVAGDCAACHVPHGSPDAPLLSDRPERLCLRCHEAMFASRQEAKLHRPFAAGRCTACHVGHGGAPHLVRPQDPCGTCHTAAERRWADARSHHAPVAQGRCAACHDPHGNGAPRLVRRTGRDLCLGCHDALARRFAAKDAVVHPPAAVGDCDGCHAPHASAERPLLDRGEPALCTGCHDVQEKAFASAHAPYDARAARCTSCHDPHVSARPRLIADVLHPPFGDRDCLTCHVRTPDGAPQPLPGVGKVCLDCHDLAPSKHDPVRKGRCFACHSPHASFRPHLLVATGADLCDRCHDRGRPRWKKLHADAGAEGMDCGDCHEAHPKK